MDMLEYKGFAGTSEIDMERCVCRGKILFIDDLVTYEAASPKLLTKAFQSAVNDYVATCHQVGKEPQRPCSGTFNVRLTPELHRQAVVRARSSGVTLNEVVVRAIDCYINARADVHHDVRVTFEPTGGATQVVQTIASGEPQWRTAHVH
jgi:predicted HicB family RNase H-like nuclease